MNSVHKKQLPAHVPLRRHLPPLKALRAFEAAARHMHFGRAAAELCVTYSAISHQVRRLEEHIGAPVFNRGGKRITLTEQGRLLLSHIQGAFDQIDRATELIQSKRVGGEIVVAAPAALSAWRLVLLLGEFLAARPDLNLKLLPIDQASPATDLIVSFGESPIAGERVPILASVQYFPVCSPKLLKGRSPLEAPDILKEHIVYHEDDGTDWRRWSTAAQIDWPVGRQQVYFPNSYLCLEAAKAGYGFAIGDDLMAAEGLREGTLVRPFTVSVKAPHPYYLIVPEGQNPMKAGHQLRDWILQNAT